MKINFNVLFIFCVWLSIDCHAQNTHWQSIYQGSWTTSPHSYYINAMYEDTVDNLLYVGGGASSSSGILVYDGDSIYVQGSYPAGCCRSFIRFNNAIYAGGTSNTKYLCKWNGNSWDTSGIAANGPVGGFCIYNGELFVGGMFTSIGGINSQGLAKYDGSTWTDVSGFPFSYNIGIAAITEYNGELFVAGSFGDSLGNTMNIARWDGQQWRDVGGGFHGFMDEVWSFEHYNNELYICGAFRMVSGNVGNYIAKWDGITLSDVGGGTMGMFNSNGQVYDMAVWGNSLFAVGVFEFAGGIFTSYISKWDGLNWCYLGDSLNAPIQCVETLDTNLFIGGGWWMIGNDTVSGFAQWVGGNYTANCGNTTDISDTPDNHEEFIIYPNPICNFGTIECTSEIEAFTLIIIDYSGRELLRTESVGSRLDFSLTGFSSGLYYYRIIQNSEVRKNGKLIVR